MSYTDNWESNDRKFTIEERKRTGDFFRFNKLLWDFNELTENK